ncbi:MAG: hypothetical protein KAI29_20690, partial [Cyclobacteriaceae bacterium]|nr:hypothetical protein [Cyclobacteriaceae bacterium]
KVFSNDISSKRIRGHKYQRRKNHNEFGWQIFFLFCQIESNKTDNPEDDYWVFFESIGLYFQYGKRQIIDNKNRNRINQEINYDQ